MMKRSRYLLGALLLAMSACTPNIEDFTPGPGSADFSKYVALGNSLTAGFADGALYRSGQEQSMPALLAMQFSTAGGGAFIQPLMVDEKGLGNRLMLGTSMTCLGTPSFGPVPYPGNVDPGNLTWIGDQGPFNNMGVPQARVSHLLAPGYGLLNPLFGRFASDPQTASILQDATDMEPSFFTLWIGGNDVLGYAVSGGEQAGDSVTDPTMYAFYLDLLLDGLTAGGAKGAIANLPDITSVPFFNTVPYAALVLTDQAQVDGLNMAYQQLGFTFSLGPNPLVIQDLNSPVGMRQALPTDLILLSIPQDSLRCAGWGSMKPVPHNFVLDAQETALIRNAINAYNISIEQEATARGLAYVDVNTILRNLQSGLIFDGIALTTTFVSGGAFSLDGVHLTPRGNAIIANAFIDAINQQFGAEVPRLVVSDYPGVLFP